MIIQKIKYGCKILINELTNQEDYWHPRLKPMTGKLACDKIYFHDMLKKGFYPGDFVDNIPVIYLNGKQQTFFYITVFNYALGLLNRYDLKEDVLNEINAVLKWTLENQKEDGSWRYNMHDSSHALADNKASGMTQGLAVSFIIRAYRCEFIEKEKCISSVSKAIEFMLSEEIVSIYNGKKLVEEFYKPGLGILNGAIFALYGLYDYCVEIDNYEIFNEYIHDLKELLSKYKFKHWSYYDRNKMINSKFYHQLHIDMMYVLYDLTNDSIFLKYAKYWEKGMKFSVFFVLSKSLQKLIHIKKMPLTYSKKVI